MKFIIQSSISVRYIYTRDFYPAISLNIKDIYVHGVTYTIQNSSKDIYVHGFFTRIFHLFGELKPFKTLFKGYYRKQENRTNIQLTNGRVFTIIPFEWKPYYQQKYIYQQPGHIWGLLRSVKSGFEEIIFLEGNPIDKGWNVKFLKEIYQ